MAKSKVLDVPNVEPMAAFVGYHVRRLSVKVMADLARSLAPLDLNPADATVLMMIGANPGITQSALGKSIGILRANMAPLVAALTERELISREPVDGRSSALRLSSRGATLERQVRQTVQTHEERLFGAMSSAARKRLALELRGLWEIVEQEAQPAQP